MSTPKCGAKTRNGGACRHEAGWGTPHPGEGRCKLHGGLTPIKHGRYSKITRPRIKELLDEFQADPEPMNLQPEVLLLRALLTDFVERYDRMSDAILAWHGSFTDGHAAAIAEYREAYDAWRSRMLALLEGDAWRDTPAARLPDPPRPPDPALGVGKPRQLIDVTAAAGLVDKVGRMVERIEKIKAEGSITLETLNRVLEQLGVEVVQAAAEEVRDDVARTALLANIERRWSSIRLEPSAARGRPAAGAHGPN